MRDPRTGIGVAVCVAVLLLAPSVGAQPVPADARGFNAPTLDGDWRVRLALNGWIPDSIPITVHDAGKSSSTTLDIGFILDHLGYAIPLDGEVRKGTFGLYLHTLTFKLVGATDVGTSVIKWNDVGSLIDVGVSYELGRWNLGEGTDPPTVKVEPFVGARLLYDPVDLDVSQVAGSATIDFSNYVPDLGIRTFWDLTEHWNLQVEGDYGGFGVDDNQQTWQAVGLVGYRWPGWGVLWNLQVGYRAMRLFNLKRSGAQVELDGRGPNVIVSMEF